MDVRGIFFHRNVPQDKISLFICQHYQNIIIQLNIIINMWFIANITDSILSQCIWIVTLACSVHLFIQVALSCQHLRRTITHHRPNIHPQFIQVHHTQATTILPILCCLRTQPNHRSSHWIMTGKTLVPLFRSWHFMFNICGKFLCLATALWYD